MPIKTVRRPEQLDNQSPSRCYFCESETIYWNLKALEPVCHSCAEKYNQEYLSRRCPECENDFISTLNRHVAGGFVLIQCTDCGYIHHQKQIENEE